MWKDKGLQLVMLPTKEKSLLWSHKGRTIRYNEANFNDVDDEERYFLYLISDEEIRTRDWVIDISDNSIFQIQVSEYTSLSKYKKVISCTDPSLNLPQFHSSFLEEYVKRYNSKQPMEVELEYMSNFISSNKGKIEFEELNTNDNTISIRFKKEKMYSRGEVERIVLNFQNDLMNSNHNKHTDIDPIGVKDWIKENLK